MDGARTIAPKVRRPAALLFSATGRVMILAWGHGLRVFAGLRLPRRQARARMAPLRDRLGPPS